MTKVDLEFEFESECTPFIITWNNRDFIYLSGFINYAFQKNKVSLIKKNKKLWYESPEFRAVAGYNFPFSYGL